MKSNQVFRLFVIIFLLAAYGSTNNTVRAQNKVSSPEQYFGFQMGEDRKLARWDKIVEYFYHLENESGKLKVINMGPSSEGHPFLVCIISSEENLSNLERLQEINKGLSDPRGLDEETINHFVEEGKAVIFQSMSLHASEVGGTQMTPELTYDLLSRTDEETQRILDNVLFFMIPCLNPDGQVMITDWYRETVNTEYEGISMPYLYHKYSGHDNNRDGDYHNLIESKYTARAMFVDWPPQAYIDHHHMGSYGARFYVPPYCDPIRPYADPLVWREISWYGSHIAYKLEEQGFQGILNAAQFAGWGHFGWHWVTPFHNIAGMLTESAGVKYATPIYIHPEPLRAGGRMFPEYAAQSTFPNPWPGGWWTLRDIVEQKKSSAWSLLDLAARNKETVLRTAYMKARNQTNRGATGDVKTVVIPAKQHDYLSAVKMVNNLLRSGIEIQKANSQFMVDNIHYDKGSYIVSLAQPKMGLIRNLLVETHYADNAWTRKEDGSPVYPYDLATHTMFEFMGVQVDAKVVDVKGDFSILDSKEAPDGFIEEGNKGYLLDGRSNQSYRAVNMLIEEGVKVKRLTAQFGDFHPGDFVVSRGHKKVIETISKNTGVHFMPLNSLPKKEIINLERGRLALFQRYNGGNMDEGWTRQCLENFNFPYHTLMGNEIKEGKLIDKWDVIILPSDSPDGIKGTYSPNSYRQPEKYPEKYMNGMGKEGVEALKEFVKAGGTLVALGSSYEFAVKEFDLKVRNLTDDLESKKFFCPGSTIKVNFDNTDPLAYGMPDEGLVLFRSSPTFAVSPSRKNTDYKTIVRYKEKDLLKSGWLIGEKNIAKKSAMLSVKYGDGRIVLIGFRTQHRNQTDGTFKLLFNTIM
ncbi:MAG: peptidase M14 family protein [Bacteroidetes bacterium]|nr:peptidase M14 family protein [Bacteroidota bacterium]